MKLTEEALKFLDGLPTKFRAKAYRSVGLLREFGPFLREPHSKVIIGWSGLLELRVAFGSDICRLFYLWHRGRYYVVTQVIEKRPRN